MKKKEVRMSILVISVLALAQIFAMVLWKDHSFVAIHDNLDLFVAHNKILKNEGVFFAKDALVGMLGGINRDLLGSEFSIYNILYFLFSPYTAYTLGYFLKIGIGFLGAGLLAKEVYGEQYYRYRELVWLLGMAFGMIPVFPAYGIAFTSLPLLLFLLKKIVSQRSWYWYLALFCYPLLSYFSYFGFFILGFLLLATVGSSLKKRKWDRRLSMAVLVLAAGYICFEYRLFQQMLFSHTVTIRESMQSADFTLWQVVKETFSVLLEPGFHAQDSHKFFLLPVVLLIMVWDIWSYGKERRMLVKDPVYFIFAWIFFNCLVYGLYGYAPFRKIFEMILPPLKGFQFNRTIFLNPFLWYLLLFLCLKKILDRGPENFWRQWAVKAAALVTLLVVMLVPQVYNDFYSNCYHHAYEILKKTPSSQLSFREFYSPELFGRIKEEIGYQGEWAVAYGMHPAVLQYNGIATLDGYLGLYSEEYKQQFRKLIAPALEKSEEFRRTFDESGIRAYLYSGAGENTYLPLKELEIKDRRLYMDKKAFQEMGGIYIFSRIKINNEKEVGVKLLKAFSDTTSPYEIYVYKRIE